MENSLFACTHNQKLACNLFLNERGESFIDVLLAELDRVQYKVFSALRGCTVYIHTDTTSVDGKLNGKIVEFLWLWWLRVCVYVCVCMHKYMYVNIYEIVFMYVLYVAVKMAC